MKFRAYIFGLYLIMFPFYIFPSGGPQLADFIGLVLILFSLKQINSYIFKYKFFYILFLFIIYSLIINLIWSLILEDLSLLKSSMNYLYCLLLTISVFFCFKNQQFSKITLRFILISFLIQFVLIPFTPREWGFRTVLFFNNPNQLALWSVNLLVIIFVITSNLKLKSITKNFLYIIPTFFAILSISKAVLVSLFFFWVFFILNKGFTFKNIFIVSILSVILFTNQEKISNIQAISNALNRIETDNLEDDSWEGRGFDRIANHKNYLFFGAGEGLNNRFKASYKGEIHSTFFNIFFSYGLVGSILFLLAFFYIIGKNNQREKVIIFLTLFIFSLGHMTLRIPLFWIAVTSIYFYQIKNSRINICAE